MSSAASSKHFQTYSEYSYIYIVGDVVGLPETAGAAQISQEGEGVADEPLGGVDHPLELLRFCNHADATSVCSM